MCTVRAQRGLQRREQAEKEACDFSMLDVKFCRNGAQQIGWSVPCVSIQLTLSQQIAPRKARNE